MLYASSCLCHSSLFTRVGIPEVHRSLQLVHGSSTRSRNLRNDERSKGRGTMETPFEWIALNGTNDSFLIQLTLLSARASARTSTSHHDQTQVYYQAWLTSFFYVTLSFDKVDNVKRQMTLLETLLSWCSCGSRSDVCNHGIYSSSRELEYRNGNNNFSKSNSPQLPTTVP